MMTQIQYDTLSKADKENCSLKGTSYYGFLQSPDTKSAERFGPPTLPMFKVSLVLDEKEQEKAKAMGFKLKEATANIPGKHIVLKRKIREDKTAEQVKPDLVDAMQQPIPESILIGNGSTLICKFATYWHQSADRTGVGATLFKTQVLDLVKYEGSTGDSSGFVNDTSGYTVLQEEVKEVSKDTSDTLEPDELPF